MTKPAPIVLIAICLVAACTLAFTIANHFEKKSKRTAAITKNKSDSALFVRKNPPHGQPGHRHDLPDGAPLPMENTASSAVSASNTNDASLSKLTGQSDSIASRSVGVNPPHGQPGHRCDIAVGAPLNSAPAKTTTAATNTKAVVASGMNPPHGQPGHRCDIAVGAPLNSPKTSASAVTATNNTKSAVPDYSFTPMQDSAQSAAPQFEYDSTGAALNPPHGKPGHDCAIPVGKPLTAKK